VAEAGTVLRAGEAVLAVVSGTNDPSVPLGTVSGRMTNVVMVLETDGQIFLSTPGIHLILLMQ